MEPETENSERWRNREVMASRSMRFSMMRSSLVAAGACGSFTGFIDGNVRSKSGTKTAVRHLAVRHPSTRYVSACDGSSSACQKDVIILSPARTAQAAKEHNSAVMAFLHYVEAI